MYHLPSQQSVPGTPRRSRKPPDRWGANPEWQPDCTGESTTASSFSTRAHRGIRSMLRLEINDGHGQAARPATSGSDAVVAPILRPTMPLHWLPTCIPSMATTHSKGFGNACFVVSTDAAIVYARKMDVTYLGASSPTGQGGRAASRSRGPRCRATADYGYVELFLQVGSTKEREQTTVIASPTNDWRLI